MYSVKQRGAYLQHSFKIYHEKMVPGMLQKFQQGCVKEQLQDSGKILNNGFKVGQKQNK